MVNFKKWVLESIACFDALIWIFLYELLYEIFSLGRHAFRKLYLFAVCLD